MQTDPMFKRVPSAREFATDSSDSTNNSVTVNSITGNSTTANSTTANSITGNSITIDMTSSPDLDGSGESSKANKNDASSTPNIGDNTLRPRKTSAPPSVNRKLSETFAGLLDITGLKTLGKKDKEKHKMKQKKKATHLLSGVDAESPAGKK
jgi:hypothetical protein